MKRRVFVGAGLATLGALAWPAWLRNAFADEACEPGQKRNGRETLQGVSVVAAAYKRATKAHVSLLVLVIPKDDSNKYERGEAFGELLNHGSDADLAPLAEVEVVCATMDELRLVAPSVPEGEPLMVLVSTGQMPATGTFLDATLLPNPKTDWEHWEDSERAENKAVEARIATLGALLRKSLGAASSKEEKTKAEAVRERLVKKTPPGTYWARAGGCGTQIEGIEDRSMVACGMGHVPEKSRRFLYFFSVENRLL